ncbi:hypothetical protein [Sandaracinus amylolyticus]|uniref:Uncharacterized protein n=1 Tax=Sandaracinus amylolyticus TaxID=927083 RepID=A0A0F6W231_9BACT|nr:hypothetical protein [Sandaracinus amylolyticus]AKF05500.1 hypothetical protein DB32_002649 [Sandaracinus amylolyticus]
MRTTPLASLFLLAACSDPAPARDDAGTDASQLDASALADASAPDSTTGAPRSGLVSLTHTNLGSHVLFGYFGPGTIEDLRAGLLFAECTIDDERGDCIALTCPGGSETATHDAGALSASIDGVELLVAGEPGASGIYSALGTGAAFEAGDVVRFAATGADVPAFSADVIAPSAPAITLPTTISRDAPLTLTWGATTAESVQVGLVGAGTGVRCIVPAARGSVTVDPALLASEALGSNTLLNVTAFTTTEVVAGDYALDVSVSDGVSAPVTLE